VAKFILLAARRSGTTLLIDCLNSHPEVDCVKRAFGLEKKIKNPTADNHAGGFYLYRVKNLANRLRYYTNRYALVDDFLQDEIFTPREGMPAAGFRLIYEMSSKYPEVSQWAQQNDAKVVHLIRGNLLKTYISTVTAAIHKMRHPREGAEIRTVKIHINPHEMIAELDRRAAAIEYQRQLFSGCPSLEVFYEDFVANRAAESGQLLRFLEVDESHDLQSDLVKINPESLTDLVENYEEVRHALLGTPHEKFLD
jgi:LPS sulfotransferase NodH